MSNARNPKNYPKNLKKSKNPKRILENSEEKKKKNPKNVLTNPKNRFKNPKNTQYLKNPKNRKN